MGTRDHGNMGTRDHGIMGSREHVSPWEGLLLFSLRPTALACYTKQILRLPNLTSAAPTGKTNTTFSLSLLHLI